jgi:murein L,D-transpeptidase YcbB/YkuD
MAGNYTQIAVKTPVQVNGFDTMKKPSLWVIAAILVLQTSFAAAQQSAVSEAIRVEIEQLRETDVLSIGGVDIAGGRLLAEVYERRNFAPNWTSREKIGELITAVKNTYFDGLDPADYHLEEAEYVYRELGAGNLQSPHEQAALDVMLTDSLFRLGYHQVFGKVNPENLDPYWNFRRELGDDPPAVTMQKAMDAPSLLVFLDALTPRGRFYNRLRAALAEYRELASAGGWPTVAEGETLRRGASDARVPLLAERLALTGDIADATPYANSNVYDVALEAGVSRFQARHGLDNDGVLGPATLRAMNVPVEDRIMQLRINLERARWVFDDVTEDFIIVNIAAFKAYVVRNTEIVWQTAVQVGRTYHQTPVFRDEMKYVVFNPTWTVPYSIATKEMLPRIKNDPDYFETRDFDIKDKSGEIVPADSIDWSQLSRGNFPYTFVQRPGPRNALGRVKFIFPNKYAIYLHDTPSKALFDQPERAFSHGCVRVENPFELAEELLGSEDWDQEKIQATLDSLETTTVYLPEPLPVLLLYWTAEIGPDNDVRFYTDVYERDGRIATALAERFKAELPEI